MASISLKLREAKDGFKIYLHFNYGRKKQLRYATGYGVASSKYWDHRKQQVENVTAEPQSNFINTQISDLATFAVKLLEEFDRENSAITNTLIKKRLDEFNSKTDKKTSKTLLQFYKWFIDYYEVNPLPKTQKPLSKNTVKPYRTALGILEGFCAKNYKVDFNDITLDFYDDFLKYLRGQNFSNNYIGNQIKLLKAVMNYAYERDLHSNTIYKKRAFAKLTEQVDAIYLTNDELEAIFSLELKSTKLDRARDLFLIGAYSGLRVSDFNRLTAGHIKTAANGSKHIEISIQKTGKNVLIPINSKILSILEKHGDKPPKRMSEQHINMALKEIGEKAGIITPFTIEKTVGGRKSKAVSRKCDLITNHTARRSFCTNAYLAGLSTIDIMAISGHKSEAVFLKYIKTTPKERLERLAVHPFFK